MDKTTTARLDILRKKLSAKFSTKPELYDLLNLTTGIKPDRIREIAEGKGDLPDLTEIMPLEMMME